eukprot:scaffold51136_cov56-Cyclotella_meneghiniana.AAC.3
MGTYLSTPITSKHVESGNDLHNNNDDNDDTNDTNDDVEVSWGVVDMQGWRKSMEDAHVARTDVIVGHHHNNNNNNSKRRRAKVFAVFDGHGGAEVARFCQMNLVNVLMEQEGWKNINNTVSTANAAASDCDDVENTNANHIGSALIHSFHALDRLILDPSKRAEIERWRSERPPVYVHGSGSAAAVAISDDGGHDTDKKEENGIVTTAAADNKVSNSNLQQELHLIGDLNNHDDDSDDSSHVAAGDNSMTLGNNDDNGEQQQESDTGNAIKEGGGHVVGMNGECAATDDDNTTGDDKSADEHQDNNNNEDDDDDALLNTLDNDAGDGIVNDDSDDEKEDASSTKTRGIITGIGADPYSLFSKLLHMNNSSSDPNDDEEEEEEEEELVIENDVIQNEDNSTINEETTTASSVTIPTLDQLMNPPTGIIAPNASIPTKIMNGRKVCNLPDLPIHAGCTSVVAVILGKDLVVANAGDSRAVICRRGGLMEPLSFDHKPLQKREMNRITRAGGFVNQFGRVNGNLNLSRSIGDLKYKQVPGIAPADQMITAEPDIISTTLRPGDEFIVIGCDGIWDCLTNEECVKYVRDRIDTKSPVEIGTEMLDDIVSEDPRASQGIGGDNMTVMIIDLLPRKRMYSHQ